MNFFWRGVEAATGTVAGGGGASGSSATVQQQQQPIPTNNSEDNRFSLRKWNATALWQWDIQLDNCAICRNEVTAQCIECQADPKGNDVENCKLAWGTCNHAFHHHCISRWLKTRKVCPLDNKEWSLLKFGN